MSPCASIFPLKLCVLPQGLRYTGLNEQKGFGLYVLPILAVNGFSKFYCISLEYFCTGPVGCKPRRGRGRGEMCTVPHLTVCLAAGLNVVT